MRHDKFGKPTVPKINCSLLVLPVCLNDVAMGLIHSATVPMSNVIVKNAISQALGPFTHTNDKACSSQCMSLVPHFLPVQLSVWHRFCWQCNMTTVSAP